MASYCGKKFLATIGIVLVLFAATASAARCHECIPDRINNYCLDYKEGIPTAARQTNCQGFCFKADGSFKIDYGVEKDRAKKFVVSACVDQRTADALEIGNKDMCQSGDKAKRLLEPIISANSNQQQQQQNQQQQSQYGQQRNQYNNQNQQQQQQQLSFHLPGRVEDARYCRCDTDLCNSAVTVTGVSASLIALSLVFAIKNLF